MSKPAILITNDDGIESHFLKALVQAHLDDYHVYVAAPAREQSWISRAITRVGKVRVSEAHELNTTAWKIEGTPSDCVNIALGHLIPKEVTIAAVLSGINLGFNAAFPFILSSGTIAGALEGVLWGLPGIAFSHCIEREDYESLRKAHGRCSGELAESLRVAAMRATEFTARRIQEPQHDVLVHNVNFPATTYEHTPIEHTIPERFYVGSLFSSTDENAYRFEMPPDITPLRNQPNTDRACLNRKHISYTELNFSAISS